MDLSGNWFENEINLKTYKNMRRIGVNTIGSNMGGKIHDIRGEIPIPKNIISPWSITNYDMSNNKINN